MRRSNLEIKFKFLWDTHYPKLLYIEEAKNIVPNRRFKFDFAFFDAKVAVEISGQIWQKGGHSSGKGLLRDYEKLNLAQAYGWIVFQLADEMINVYWLKIIFDSIKSRRIS